MSADLERIARGLDDAGLSPIIDRPLARVLALCPVCGSPDPQGIWRSLVVATYGGVRIICTAGCRDDAVHGLLGVLLRTRERANAV